MTEESAVQITPVEASVLLSAAEWDPALFVKTLAEDWEVTVPEKDVPASPEDSLVFEHEGVVIAIKLFNEPLPAEMTRMHAAMNPLWPQAKDVPASPEDSLVFEHEGVVIAIKLFNEPLPAEMTRMHAAMNPLWPQAGAIAQLHRAHLAVAAIPKTASLLDAAQMLVKVAAALCLQPSALAIDNGSTIIGTDGYREGAVVMKGGELPLFNLVTFAIAKADV